MKFAVFASGNGGNLQAIIDAVRNKKIKAQLSLVFSDKPHSLALTRAQKAKIETSHLSPHDYASRKEFDQAILHILKEHHIDFIVLAGYMRLLSVHFIESYHNKILNIHPSLLPAFPGLEAWRQAVGAKAKKSGCTVHYVDGGMDTGEIIELDAENRASGQTTISNSSFPSPTSPSRRSGRRGRGEAADRRRRGRGHRSARHRADF